MMVSSYLTSVIKPRIWCQKLEVSQLEQVKLFLKFRLGFLKLVLYIAQQLVHQNLAIWVTWFALAFGELELLSPISVTS
nr:hypothetical protein LR48_Vigan08g064000 [Ipomoea batatas]GMD34943.1 hypothetical protein LR48_Vigan08g064000 [Ipomoea batatas]